MRLGSERLLASATLDGTCIGLVCNPASVDGELHHVADRIAAHPGARLSAIFGPQHGFRSDVQDNMIETRHAHDEVRRVPVYSLYSEVREPTAEMLQGLDALVIDLQDVGVRIYTYIYTLANCLTAARRHKLNVIVCDRPNPIGGAQVEGMVLVPGFESFVGMYPIPMRHGMTIGELARLFNEHFGVGADLEVVAMEGWRRDMYWDDTGLAWIISSPNIPTFDTTLVYPGGVLFEGTKGQLLADYGKLKVMPESFAKDFTPPPKSIPTSIGHHKEWTEAIKTGGPTTCNFDYAGALTECVLLGTVSYRLGKGFDWDAAKFRASEPGAKAFLAK